MQADALKIFSGKKALNITLEAWVNKLVNLNLSAEIIVTKVHTGAQAQGFLLLNKN